MESNSVRAGDGDRTRMASLEGWSSTIELHPHASYETRKSLEHVMAEAGLRFVATSNSLRLQPCNISI
jgi:hypothetical protein